MRWSIYSPPCLSSASLKSLNSYRADALRLSRATHSPCGLTLACRLLPDLIDVDDARRLVETEL